MADMLLLYSLDRRPEVHLALEEVLLDAGPEDVFLLYRNAPCVVVGKNQNPWVEVAPDVLATGDPPVFRRLSGGGTVYHDAGNLNWCFIGFENNRRVGLELITRAIHKLGIEASFTDKGDILVNGAKVSGSAQANRRGRGLHHGTLLVASDLDRLAAVLAGPRDFVVSGPSVKSRPAAVGNLRDWRAGLTIEEVEPALFDVVAGARGGGPPRLWDGVVERSRVEAVSSIYRNWDWTFGRTPDFFVRLDDGRGIEVVGGRPVGRPGVFDPNDVRRNFHGSSRNVSSA